MNKQLNITLSQETLDLINQLNQQGDPSDFIHEAVQHYIHEKMKANLRTQLQEGAIRRAERDLELAEEWFDLEEEAWQSKT